MELTVPVDGGHLWADDTGGGGPVLALLHPGWGDSSIWLPMLGSLRPRYRVIRYDTRGFGRSPAPEAPFAQLNDLIAVLDHCGVTEVMLVGHSGGGGTAVGLALSGPRRNRGTWNAHLGSRGRWSGRRGSGSRSHGCVLPAWRL